MTRLLLATTLEPTAAALRSLALRRGHRLEVLGDGLLELRGDGLEGFLSAARLGLAPGETAEVRCLLTDLEPTDGSLVAQAMRARSLDELGPALEPDEHVSGLPDRWSLLEQLELSIDRSSVDGRALAVLLLELEGCEDDRVLAEVAARLRAALRGSDLLARHDELELAAVLGSLDGPDAERVGWRVAGDLLRALERPVVVGGAMVPVSARIGIALFPRHGWSAHDLLDAADAALHQAGPHRDRAVLAGG